MNNNYDLIIVGMGPSSVFCAYELIKLNSKKKILLIVAYFPLTSLPYW